MRGISTAVIGAAVVVVIVFLGGAFFFLTQQSSSTSGTSTSVTTTSSTSVTTTSSTTTSSSFQGTPPPGARAAFDRHLSEIGTRDIPTVLTDYQDNAVVVWTGNTAGLGGVYNGVGNIFRRTFNRQSDSIYTDDRPDVQQQRHPGHGECNTCP